MPFEAIDNFSDELSVKKAESPFSQLVLSAIDTANDVLRETTVDVETQAQKLSHLFRQLSENSEIQMDRLTDMFGQMGTITHEGQEIELLQVPKFLEESLQEMSDRLLMLSKQGVGLIYSLDEILSEMTELNSCIHEVEAINRQTRLLSLNAQIEAVRAGDSASGFQVVSGEMLSVSKRIDALSQRMLSSTKTVTESIEEVISSIREEYQELSRIGALDFSTQIDARKSLELLVDGLVNKNQAAQDTIGGSAETSRQITDDIREVVMSMQFQDRMKQRTDAIIGALNTLSEFMLRTPNLMADEKSCLDLAREIVNAITLSDVRRRFEQKLLGIESEEPVEDDGGDIELF